MKIPYTATAELSDMAILLEFVLIVDIKVFWIEILLCSCGKLIKAAEIIFFLKKSVHLRMQWEFLRNHIPKFGKAHISY